MRTAVVRVNVDPRAELAGPQLAGRMAAAVDAAVAAGLELVPADPAVMASTRRELQFLVLGDDVEAVRRNVVKLCADAFGTEPVCGAVTFISRGSDDDALGVLAGFGVVAEVSREPGADGWDVVRVRLPRAELDRVPESRLQTALEAALNCEVEIIPV